MVNLIFWWLHTLLVIIIPVQLFCALCQMAISLSPTTYSINIAWLGCIKVSRGSYNCTKAHRAGHFRGDYSTGLYESIMAVRSVLFLSWYQSDAFHLFTLFLVDLRHTEALACHDKIRMNHTWLHAILYLILNLISLRHMLSSFRTIPILLWWTTSIQLPPALRQK